MVLFHDAIGHRSQKVRIVIAEKGITCNLEILNKDDLPKEILEINPEGHLPLLVDRELSLYHSGLIVEYLDERFPHPPLLPVYPVSRAQFRLILQRIENWYKRLPDLIIFDNQKFNAEFGWSKDPIPFSKRMDLSSWPFNEINN